MKKAKKSGATLGFENKLWEMADKMRGHMDSGEYKHVVLGLIFLKYISDAFQAKHDSLSATAETDFTDPEDRDEYAAANIFWVPREARWEKIQAEAKQPTIGAIIDDAMVAIEKENSTLKGVLPKDYSWPALDKHRLGELVDIISNIDLQAKQSGVKDPLGRVYEYFLGRFAAAEGKGGGFLKQLSTVLMAEFPGLKGALHRNLKAVRQWYLFYYQGITIGQQPVANLALIPAGHNLGYGP